MKGMNGQRVQSITLFQPAGDIRNAVRTVAAQHIRQQAGGGDTIHIIVTEHSDLFSPGHGKTYPSGSQIHILHQERIG